MHGIVDLEDSTSSSSSDDNIIDSSDTSDDTSISSYASFSDESESRSIRNRKRYEKVQQREYEILGKVKPKYNISTMNELFYRELGTFRLGRRILGKTSKMFPYRFSGSLRSVERLELMFKLNEHTDCVNSLGFSKSGKYLVSGSDDLKIIVWKWQTNQVAYEYDSGHSLNVFQTKFMDLGNNQMNIVSSARDGYVSKINVFNLFCDVIFYEKIHSLLIRCYIQLFRMPDDL